MPRRVFLSAGLLACAAQGLHAQNDVRAFPSWAVLTAQNDELVVTGIVANAENGNPLPDVTIRLGDDGSRSNADGWFRVRTTSPSDSATIVVQHADYDETVVTLTRDNTRPFFLLRETSSPCEAPGADADRDRGQVIIQLRDQSTASGIDGRLAAVTTNVISGETRAVQTRLDDGVFVANIVAPGVYTVAMTVAGYAPFTTRPFLVRRDPCARNEVASQVQSVSLTRAN